MIFMWEEILEQPSIISGCFDVNYETIKKIVAAVKKMNVNSVFIAARGTSDHAAVYGKYVIELSVGIPVALAAPSIFTVYQKSVDLSKSLVIGVSQSGRAEDVLEVIKAANKQNAVTVSITNFMNSPLACESMYHLFCNAGLERSVAATKTFTAELYLIAWLAAEWAQDEGLKKDLLGLSENIESTFNAKYAVIDKVKRYRYMNECFILARGVNYAIALESALKIQETTYVRAKAYATSDFYHGPYAMIDKDMPVMIFAPSGPTFDDVMKMAHKLKQSRAELIIVSNNREALDFSENSFSIPKTENDIISPFYNIAIAQMFACQLAIVKGLNPDAPRNLNKVTITR